MAKLPVLVLRAAGINCDEEVMHGWSLAGAAPTLMHINELVRDPSKLKDYQIVTFPGGFSYGDDIAAGVILAQRIALDLAEPMQELVQRGGGLLGICNGFQVLVKAGLLPGGGWPERCLTVTYNDSAKFEARWVKLRVATDRCVFLEPGSTIELPIEHAEGRVVVKDDTTRAKLLAEGNVAVRYVDDQGRYDVYPANPNASEDGIAGLCDDTGRVLGLMPHPDRFLDATNHPLWTRRGTDLPVDGLAMFQRAVARWS